MNRIAAQILPAEELDQLCPRCKHPWRTHLEGVHADRCCADTGAVFPSPMRDNNDYVWCECRAIPPSIVARAREEKRIELLAKKCTAHPRYQLKRPPRTACQRCWQMWIKLNPEETDG